MATETAAPPLPIRSLHHVARVTRRLEESRAFYRDVLGFQEISRPQLGFPGAWLFNYGLQIHLIVNEPSGEERSAGPAIETRDNHLAFLVEDIEVVESRLKGHGVAYRVNLQSSTGLKQIFFRDPDGHHVEMGCYPR
ncbi:MAG TPA: VOC family protein [Pirellulales bacterium]|nr:VOC family protein [Pirellulales bacterium]